MYISSNTIVSAATLMGAVIAIFSMIFTIYRWYLRQNKQDVDIKHMKEEMTLLCYCMSATLDGLLQQGCNHTVPEAKDKLDKYLNKKAHDQIEE